jgi:tRNA A-37 threonylcarbamoyl transferase component Bud32
VAERVLGSRYRVIRHLARGGMAEVYVAEDELLSRSVAVKVLFPELAQDEQFVERFRREARAAASLNHHNIVSVYDFGEDEDSWFIVMEYVKGPTLRDIIRSEGAMEPGRAAGIAAEVAAALAVAHAQGIVHRDVKPANVLLADPEGTVKVTDFGIARAANARQSLTMPGTVLGTATYLSPEQAQGGEVDRRTDIYSLGLVLYEMLAGKPPFTGDTPVAIAYQAVREIPPPPSTHNPRVPAALDAIVMRAIAKDPAGRYPSATEMRSALLSADRAVRDPEATAAIAPPPAAEKTAVVAPSTSVLPPVTEVGPLTDPSDRPARRAAAAAEVSDSVYRRRRAAVLAGLALLAALIVVAIVALSGGSKTKVPVPDVTGRPVSEAQATIDGAGLTSSVTEEDRAGAAGTVVAQDPPPQKLVNKGSKVKLVVPRGATSTTSQPAPTAPPATTATTRAATTTTAAPTTTTQAPTTTTPPTTVAPPTSSIVVPTTVVVSTTVP